jgi:cytoskeletal protein CcmA (bactofilin family)
LIVADEAILEEISTDDLNAGVADIGTLRWTHGRAVGSSSTTDLDGTLNVDGRAWFRSNVYLDSNLYVNQDIYVDTIKNLTADGLVLQSDDDIVFDAGTTDLRGNFDDLYFNADGGQGSSTAYFELEPDSDDDADAELRVDNPDSRSRLWMDVDEGGDDADVHIEAYSWGSDNMGAEFQLESYDGTNASAEMFASDDWSDGVAEIYVEYDTDGTATLGMQAEGWNGRGGVYVDGWDDADSVAVNIDADALEVSAPSDFNGTVNIDGAATLNSTMDVDGATTLNSTLDVDGTTTLNDSLHVDLGAGFGSNIWVAGNGSVSGNFDVDGATTLDGLSVSEDASFDMDVDITGDMTVDDASGDSLDFNFAQLDKILSDSISNVTAAGLVLSSSSDIRLHGDSVVSNTSIFANSTLDVDGATTLNSSLDVDGHTELNDSLHVDGGVDFDSNLNVDGNTTMAGDLDVDGRTTLDSTWVAEYFQFDGSDFDVNASDEVTVDGNTIDLNVTDAEISMSTEEIDIALPNSGDDYYAEIFLSDDAGDSEIGMWADYISFNAYQTDIWSDDDINIGTDGDLWVVTEESIEIYSNEDYNGYHGLYIDVEDDNDPMEFLPEADSDYEVELYSDDAVSVNANYDAGLELNADVNAALLYGDSVLIDGRFVVRDNADFYSDVEIDGSTYLNGDLDVDGATTLNSTLDVDGASTLNSTLDVDGATTLNDSLDVDLHTELNSTLNVDGGATFESTMDVDGATTLNSTLDVDGATTLNDSLDVDLHTELNSTLNVDGFANFNDSVQFNDNVNIDATMTVDSAIVEESMKIYTPAYPGLDAPTLSEPEFEILNVAGDPIFEVDGHNDDVIAENLTVNGVFTTQDWIVNDDISADDISAAGVVTAGNTTYGSEWGTGAASPNNWLTRKDYVDFHRQAATGVLQAFSYDADLIGGATDADYNEAVYYMNGDLVLYADSVESANSKNYTITVKGENFNSLVDEDGAPLDIEAAIWAENNELAITAASHNLSVVDDNTITFEIGYEDINGIVACTSGKVRPTLALGSATYGMQMTGLHFFIEIEEAAAID